MKEGEGMVCEGKGMVCEGDAMVCEGEGMVCYTVIGWSVKVNE